MATNLRWQPPLGPPLPRRPLRSNHVAVPVSAFQRGDFHRFERDAWRRANDGFEEFVFEAKKTAERIDRRYSISRRLSTVALSASYRAREIDRELELSHRWRTFSMDFSRYWPRYRKRFSDFLDTPLGGSYATILFLWLALSGWLFQFLIFATWILLIAGPLLIGTVAKNLAIKGACPACERRFVGYKNRIVRCASCGNIVWQPEGENFFSRGGGRGTSSSKVDPEIMDVDFEAMNKPPRWFMSCRLRLASANKPRKETDVQKKVYYIICGESSAFC